MNVHSKKPGDWRPITQIKIPGRILERCAHTQLYSFLMKIISVLNNMVFGLKKVPPLLFLTYKNWNDKLFQTCVFIVFSKAFDYIDHTILIAKLKLYGLDESMVCPCSRGYMRGGNGKESL